MQAPPRPTDSTVWEKCSTLADDLIPALAGYLAKDVNLTYVEPDVVESYVRHFLTQPRHRQEREADQLLAVIEVDSLVFVRALMVAYTELVEDKENAPHGQRRHGLAVAGGAQPPASPAPSAMGSTRSNDHEASVPPSVPPSPVDPRVPPGFIIPYPH